MGEGALCMECTDLSKAQDIARAAIAKAQP
jgi:hypothetical protein